MAPTPSRASEAKKKRNNAVAVTEALSRFQSWAGLCPPLASLRVEWDPLHHRSFLGHPAIPTANFQPPPCSSSLQATKAPSST